MKIRTSKLTQAVAGAALLAGVSLPAAAAVEHRDIHHRIAHRTYHPVGSNDITVRARAPREPVAAAPDAFHGPAAIVTAFSAYLIGLCIYLKAPEIAVPAVVNEDSTIPMDRSSRKHRTAPDGGRMGHSVI